MGWYEIGLGSSFPYQSDLADVLGNMDLNFDDLCLRFFWIPSFQIQISKIWAGLGLGQARLEPSGPQRVDFRL